MIKRLLLVLVLAAAAAFAVWFGMRGGSPKISSTTVTSLLPKETVALIQVTDVRELRSQWHDSDLYKIWREPAVQAFLQKPMASHDTMAKASGSLQQLDALGIHDAFFALVSAQEAQPKFVAGFRFEAKPEDMESWLAQWRGRVTADAATRQRTAVTYQQHPIETQTEGAISLLTCYAGDWFLAANDLPALQALLDRVDGRAKDPAGALASDENFTAALKHMPRRYLAFGYARLDRYFEKLASNAEDSSTKSRLDVLRQIRCAAGTIGFEHGKVRDVLFVRMPKVPEPTALTRSSLALTTADTFLYLAGFADFPDIPTGTTGVPAALQSRFSTLTDAGITAADWKSAFGGELGVIGEWNANARLPALLLTLPVRDAAKARQLVGALTIASGGTEEAPWSVTEKGGVQYSSQAPSSPMVPLAPTIAVSDRLLIAGFDPNSVEAAMNRSGTENAAFPGSTLFKAAERLVPTAQSAFLYLDTALLYNRLDAAIRPILVMAAAFMPTLVQTIDVEKLPPADAVTSHLSPIVLSQNYETDGYITESVGPVSIFEAGLAGGAAVAAGKGFYQRRFASPTPQPTGP